MTRLSININKIATLRNARGGNNPDLLKVAKDIESFGAQGITVHPRPDERHIRYQDVYDLKKHISTEFNIEGYPNEKFIKMVMDIKPDQVTLVPDSPDVLTSNAGWDAVKNRDMLKDVLATFQSAGIRTSLFMDPDENKIGTLEGLGCDRIELYTESYAANYSDDPEKAISPYIKAANRAIQLGLGINAGHDLDLKNLHYFKNHIPELKEVSIGHALICDSIYFGLENTVNLYLRELR